MQRTQSEKLTFSFASFSPKTEFIFTSEHRSLIASGINQTVIQPAIDGDDNNSLFQRAIQRAFSLEKQKGVNNPIIIGSIPFDVSQPSCLYVPTAFEFIDRHAFQHATPNISLTPPAVEVLSSMSVPNEHTFKSAVSQAVEKFQSTRLEKAVLSRVLNIEVDGNIAPEYVLRSLMAQNPTGYHFSIPQADGSILLGASPELLIRKQGEQFSSNPLAGSAKRQQTEADELRVSQALLASTKDRYEHRLVIDEIQRLLAPYCLELHVPEDPSLINTPAMWHLSTKISGTLKSSSISALQLACLLHPTPAVCGFPFDLSRSAINELESFERGMFSGMVGWCDAEGNGEWVVTIRCGKVLNNTVSLFAGAGIVDASCPQSEWAETEAKLGTMLNAFGLKSKESA
ncbi:isochorismate synthase [Photobacterium indicum]|uniref:isochorismate synthase n=1 Tax=Photobacterium indicum TaxID=81447 RepID=UPI003D09BEE2